MLFSKQKYYEYDNKPSRLLANQIKKEYSEQLIKSVKTLTGSHTYDPKVINTTCKNDYQYLHKPQHETLVSDIAAYFDNIPSDGFTA